MRRMCHDAPPATCGWEEGIVLKGVGGFYSVLLPEGEVVVCQQRGKLRQKAGGIYPGDRARINRSTGEAPMLEEILPRRNCLTRPKVANVDRAFLVLAAKEPAPDWLLLDRMLIVTQYHAIQPIICVNKWDCLTAVGEKELTAALAPYRAAGFTVFSLSAQQGKGLEPLQAALAGRISVFTGPSGVGKSSLLNALAPDLALATGQISQRLGRGKHTTRHVEMLSLADHTLVADTPGYSLLDLPADLPWQELCCYYPEFQWGTSCRFEGCVHHKEPDCQVKAAVAAGRLDQTRYERYLRLLTEMQNREETYR